MSHNETANKLIESEWRTYANKLEIALASACYNLQNSIDRLMYLSNGLSEVRNRGSLDDKAKAASDEMILENARVIFHAVATLVILATATGCEKLRSDSLNILLASNPSTTYDDKMEAVNRFLADELKIANEYNSFMRKVLK